MGGPTDSPLTFDEIVAGKGTFMKFDTEDMHHRFKNLTNWIHCADGTILSVQASHTHYCLPRTDDGPYFCIEIGYPTVAPSETWAEYFDGEWGKDDPTSTVYGYVPVELVRQYIEAHGGEVAPVAVAHAEKEEGDDKHRLAKV